MSRAEPFADGIGNGLTAQSSAVGSPPPPLDLTAIRRRLAALRGQEYWRSLEELAQTEEFQAYLHHEFPYQSSGWLDAVSRRQFLKYLGASLALAGLSACTQRPDEKIVPYVRQPEDLVPGKPLFFATALSLAGLASGVLVASHMGRPTKVEGNPDHPASLGATEAFAQASPLTLYDPDRSQVMIRNGQISTWNTFLDAVASERDTQRGRQGAGLRVLTETVTSPTLAAQLRELLDMFPAAKWYQYEPAGRDTVRAGARLAFAEYVDVHYRFDKADVILALDADFLFQVPGSVRYARDFIAKRRVGAGQAAMNRLYVVESTPTITGAMADHRLPLRAREIEPFARAVARELGALEEGGTTLDVGTQQADEPQLRPSIGNARSSAIYSQWIKAVVSDLRRNRSASIVVAGDQQPPIVHALAHAMNQTLSNVGNTVIYTDPVEANPVDQTASLRELVQDMAGGGVDMLVILGGNPGFMAPADVNFAAHLAKVRLRIHLGLYEDETAALCHWHIPATHDLEAWSDARAYDGTISIIQPLIAPLYAGKSAHEVLAVLTGHPDRTSYEIVRDYWRSQHRADDFEQFWRRALHDGLMAGTALPVKSVAINRELSPANPPRPEPSPSDAQGLEIIFRPDPTIWDGRFANNGWLQELPKPLTKLTWDNAALISPATAERLGLSSEELVELRYRGRVVRAPILIVPGHADDAVTVHLGYGRTHAGRVGTDTGFNAYALRTSDAPWFSTGLEIHKTGAWYPLARTDHHFSLEGRNLVRVGTLEQFRQDPNFVHATDHEASELPSLYPEYPYSGYAWGMAIDLNACIGCNACVVACQAENNSPVVGKTQVARGREMHWLRIDRYYKGDLDNPEVYHQPVLCMHCEHAPCELVCPVGATVHSDEGLNDMVYNRCVGTRYCSNNCPYKVRRFNFLQYADFETPSLKLGRNPNVTVRSRGVMEKCTYCVQRINAARIKAEEEDRPIRDGEVVTACQAACPTQAIVFGNINDPSSRVAKLKAESLNYGLLTTLNTRPRTTYLARLRNPNPEVAERETRG
jgi:MoCo/4Fe-4S cofactor protein with predicted Tat translocation signal